MNGSLFTSPKRSQKIERFWGIFSHCVFFYLVGLVLMTGFVCHWYYYCGKIVPRFVLFVCVLEKILVRTSRQYKSYRHVCFFSSSWFLQQKFAYYVPKPQIFMATERPMNNNIKTNTISWILVTIKVLLPAEAIKTCPILSKFGENEVIFFSCSTMVWSSLSACCCALSNLSFLFCSQNCLDFSHQPLPRVQGFLPCTHADLG